MKTAKEFLESKTLTLSKDIFDGYKITHSYLNALLEEYAQLKVNELNKADVIKAVCVHCGKGKEMHTVHSAMCLDRMHHFEQTVL